MNTVIIAGCAGFLGRYLSAYLINSGYRVVGIDNLSSSSLDNIIKVNNMIFYEAPLEDFEVAYPLFEEINKKYSPIAIFDFTCCDYQDISFFARNQNYKKNILASSNIINASIEHGWRIIYGSSSSIYCKSNEPPFKEEMPTNPISPYDIAKNAIELDIVNSSKMFDLSYNILRIDKLVGQYFNTSSTNNIFNKFVRNVINKQPIIIEGDGKNKISMLDAEYCAAPIARLINGGSDILSEDTSNNIFNIGGINILSVTELADIVLQVGKDLGYSESKKIYTNEPNLTLSDSYCDITKTSRMLGLMDQTAPITSIQKIFDWHIKSPQMESREVVTIYETEKNLYEHLKQEKRYHMSFDIKETKKELIDNFKKETTTLYKNNNESNGGQ